MNVSRGLLAVLLFAITEAEDTLTRTYQNGRLEIPTLLSTSFQFINSFKQRL